MPSNCLEHDVLARFAEGMLAPDVADSVISHLSECPHCETAVDELHRGSTSQDPLIATFRQVVSELPFQAEFESAGVVDRVRAHLSVEGLNSKDTNSEKCDVPLPERLRDYQLLDNLGDGGMGVVFRARHTRLDRIVALKLIRPDRVNSAASRERFAREMKAAGQLEHPNVVRALDAGEASGQHFLAMEFVDGDTLTKLVQNEGPLPIDESCRIIAEAAAGLQHIHKSGLVHRDIKPSNLMRCRFNGDDDSEKLPEQSRGPGAVKILDLGLALLTEREADGLTSHDQVMGTYDYIAPEQARRSHEVDIRADIYSLGCTFYFLLTGSPPFPDASPAEKLVAHQLESPTPLRQYREDVPEAVSVIVQRMMSKSADDRFATPAEVVVALNSNGDGSIPGKRTPQRRAVKQALSRSAIKKLVGAIIGLFALAGLIALLMAKITISTPQGDVVVKLAEGVDAEDLRMEVIGNGQIHIADADNNWKIHIKEGTYRARLLGGMDELELKPDRIHVIRDEIQRVSVTLRPPAPKPHVEEFVSVEREVARWVLSVDGKVACYRNQDKYITTVEKLPAEPLELHSIDLTGAAWALEDIQRLPTLPNLDRLIIGPPKNPTPENSNETGFQFTSEVTETLSNLPTLRVLHFRNVPLDDDLLLQFSSARQVRLMTISGSAKISHEQLDRLREALPEVRILSDVDQSLTDTTIDQAKEDLPPVAIDRRVARWVISLHGDVCVNKEVNVQLVESEQLPTESFQLTTIDLRGCRISTEELRRLNGLDSLWRLYLGALWGPTGLNSNTIDVLATCDMPNLKKLYIYHVPIGNDGLKNLKRIPHVFELALDGTAITDEGLASVAELPELHNLLLDHTKITGSGLVHLAGHDIQTLQLVETPLTEAAFVTMPDWPNLDTLRIDGTPLTDRAIQSLSRYPTLRDLGLNLLTNTSHKAWSVFEHLPELTKVRFRVNPNSVDDRLFAHLAHCKKLEHLDLELCQISDVGLKRLDNPSLKYLDLRTCPRLTSPGVNELKQRRPDCRIISNFDASRTPPRSPITN
ncbi:MAG: protein kinase [Rubripirellula sp.]